MSEPAPPPSLEASEPGLAIAAADRNSGRRVCHCSVDRGLVSQPSRASSVRCRSDRKAAEADVPAREGPLLAAMLGGHC